ncbi:hypothetical protein F66182_4138 [Fusarium sp. NRRL 66182]|nr:hypothetical protein F66182_4138 [Fusarium sp. NRRL 66182]
MAKNSNRSDDESRHHRSQIEEVISVCRLTDKPGERDYFTNKGPLVYPPWARGAYGGQIMAQALLAAYETVTAECKVHSMHCHFIYAVNIHLPVIYIVERARDSRSFATRIIRATQQDHLVFWTTIGFATELSALKILQHAVPKPAEERPPTDKANYENLPVQSPAGQANADQPCDCVRTSRRYNQHVPPSERKFRQWVRARGTISDLPLKPCEGECKHDSCGSSSAGVLDNHHAHAAALTYMSDNYFLGVAFRAHNASRFSGLDSSLPDLSPVASAEDGFKAARQASLDALVQEEQDDNEGMPENDQRVSMAATMDHTIFFHGSHRFRADEWMLIEMESPWADSERGLVVERVWGQDGTLIATCIQEGVIRLSQSVSQSNL